jgi:hypothetical protein
MRAFASPLAIVALCAAACTPETSAPGGDGDADTDGSSCDPAVECCGDEDCSDRLFCNGIERCQDGRCVAAADVACNDGIACTLDGCDEARNRCTYAPVHEQCDDADLCNGDERCVPSDGAADGRGCVPGPALRCDDGDPCTEDFCEAGECRTRIRDADDDGYADASCVLCSPEDPTECVQGDDCDDVSPGVHPGADEICGDGLDNDCDQARDYADPPCTVPNDSCAAALELTSGVTVHSSTRSATADIATACAASGVADVAFVFSLTRSKDVTVEIGATRALTAVLTPDCGIAGLETRCMTGRNLAMQARGLPAGRYFVVVSAEGDADFSIEMRAEAPGTDPAADTCDSVIALEGDGTAATASLVGAHHDYELSCVRAGDLLDAVFEVVVAEELIGDFRASVAGGTGALAMTVQDTCGWSATERACWTGTGEVSGRLWRLPPGTYSVIVGHDAEEEVEVTATLAESVPGVHFFEDFTMRPTDWTLSGAWQHGTPRAGGEPAPDEGPCIAASMGGSYPSDMTWSSDYAETPAIDLGGATAPELRFRSWLETEDDYDGGHLEISVAGGPWTLLDDPSLSPAYDGPLDSGEPGWSGNRQSWEDYSVSLAAYAGQIVSIRFAMSSDYMLTYRGWYVDQVVVLEP